MNKFIAETTALGMDVDTEGLFSPDCPDPGHVDVPLDQLIVYRSSDDEEDCTHHQGQAGDRLGRQVKHIPAGTATRMIPRSANASNDATHIVE